MCFFLGKGGSKIRELQEASGARIHVLRDEDSGDGRRDEAKIQLSGSVEVRHKAQQLIEELIYPQNTGSAWSTCFLTFFCGEGFSDI